MSVLGECYYAYRAAGLNGVYQYLANDQQYTEDGEAVVADPDPIVAEPEGQTAAAACRSQASLWDILENPDLYAMAALTGSIGCASRVDPSELGCEDTDLPSLGSITVGLNQSIQAGRIRASFTAVAPEIDPPGAYLPGLENGTIWIRAGLNGAEMLEPTGLSQVDQQGFPMLRDQDTSADSLGLVSYGEMIDATWGHQVYRYGDIMVTSVRVTDWESPNGEQTEVWIQVDEDGNVLCGGALCLSREEANEYAEDLNHNLNDGFTLPQNGFGDVDVSQMEVVYAYYQVNEEGQYIETFEDEDGELRPRAVRASRRPQDRGYDNVPDPEHGNYTPEEFRALLMGDGIPERGIAGGLTAEQIDQMSIPLQVRLTVTDQFGNSVQFEVPENGGYIALEDINRMRAVMLPTSFYQAGNYHFTVQGEIVEREVADDVESVGVMPEYVYGTRANNDQEAVIIAIQGSCDDSEPEFNVEGIDGVPEADGDADGDSDGDIAPADADADADEDMDADIDEDEDADAAGPEGRGAFYNGGTYRSMASATGSRYDQTAADAICAGLYADLIDPRLLHDGALYDDVAGYYHSEGQSYLMYISSEYEDRTTFDLALDYTDTVMRLPDTHEYYPLIGWRCPDWDCMDRTTEDLNSAPDADSLIALSLRNMAVITGDTAYSDQAAALEAAILAHAVTPGNQLAYSPRNMEWFAMAYQMAWVFRALAEYTGDARFDEMANNSFALTALVMHSTTGLVPEGTLADGSPIPGAPADLGSNFEYSAVRVPMWQSIYEIWFGDDDRAVDYLDTVVPFFADLGSIVDGYNLDGTPLADATAAPGSWYAAIAAASVSATSEENAVALYNSFMERAESGVDTSYYDLALMNIACLAMTGRLQMYGLPAPVTE